MKLLPPEVVTGWGEIPGVEIKVCQQAWRGGSRGREEGAAAGEAAAAYKVVLTKCWKMRPWQTHSNDWSLPDRRTQGATLEGNRGGRKSRGRLDPHRRSSSELRWGPGRGPDPDGNTDTCTPTCEPPLWRALGGVEEREGVTRPQPDLGASLSQSPAWRNSPLKKIK